MSDPTPAPESHPQPADPLEGLTAEQQREIDRRMAATRKQAEADAKRKHDDAIAKAKTDADQKAEIDLKVKSGEFDQAKQLIESERDTVKGERDSLKAENDRYANVVATVLAEREKVLEGITDKALKDAYPKDASPLERLAWLDDPRTKAALSVATEAAKVATAQGQPRQPHTPKPNGTNKPEIKPQPGIIY